MDSGRRRRKPHDALFRTVFGDPACAWSLARVALPRRVLRALGPVTLEAVPGEVVDDLRSGQHDVVLAVTSARLRRPLLLLIEHQRTQRRLFASRMARSILRLRAARRREHGPPTVLPLLVHQGAHPWRRPLRLTDEEECPAALREALGRHVLDLEVPLLDLASWTPGRLVRWPGPPEAGLALALLRGACDGRDGSLRTLERFGARFRALRLDPEARRVLDDLVTYTLATSHSPREQVVERIEAALGPEARGRMKTLGDRLFEEGEAKGKVEGEAKGEAKGKREIIGQLLEAKFGRLPAQAKRRLASASLEELGRWTPRLLDAERLEDVLGPPRRRGTRKR